MESNNDVKFILEVTVQMACNHLYNLERLDVINVMHPTLCTQQTNFDFCYSIIAAAGTTIIIMITTTTKTNG
uniref:Uncharacterized protein n=1 Tax=Glossina pallidipes TaxID=7398 RepID=A0A1A9ZCG3_GLOPL